MTMRLIASCSPVLLFLVSTWARAPLSEPWLEISAGRHVLSVRYKASRLRINGEGRGRAVRRSVGGSMWRYRGSISCLQVGKPRVARPPSPCFGLHDREEGVKVTQPKLPADVAFPIDPSGHMNPVISVERSREFPLAKDKLLFVVEQHRAINDTPSARTSAPPSTQPGLPGCTSMDCETRQRSTCRGGMRRDGDHGVVGHKILS